MWENATLLSLSRFARHGFLSGRRENAVVSEMIRVLEIKSPSAETPTVSLSGGTQQKVLFARTPLAEPPVLLADEPTRGVDAGARLEIYQLLRNAAEDGKAVVVLSTDVVELQGLCDRVAVFSRGEVVRVLASQVGIGDPTVGVTYTLTSITAVVLGGASIFGGRGSFVGALLGAVLIQEIITSTTFLQLGIDWQSYLPGLLILAGAGVYSRVRRTGRLSGNL